jgi:hypothetical protein
MSGFNAFPARPQSHWPIGMRLRFKGDADLRDKHSHLKGTPVVVLSELQLIGPSEADGAFSWRQAVMAMTGGITQGWARPDQLELPIDGQDREPDYVTRRLTQKS